MTLGSTTLNEKSCRVYSVSRVYKDACTKRPQEYWDYEQIKPLKWGDVSEYEIMEKVGHGKYSEVFRGIHIMSKSRCVIKALKPVRLRKIHREISMLMNLSGGPNIVELLDIVKNQKTKIPALIFEEVENVDFKQLYPLFTFAELQCYFAQLLEALDYAHSMGVMHRDVKPQNIMINPFKRQLKLIDWGLAEYYHPGVDYNVRVASRYHKGPELLVELKQYDYSLDLWSVGCMIAAIVFKREPMFRGNSNTDQLVQITKVLGTKKLFLYLDKYGIELPHEYDTLIKQRPRIPWEDFVNVQTPLATPETIDLIDKLVRYDHQERLTAKETLNHKFFKMDPKDFSSTKAL
ncbi:casein kinase II subunit alpha/alpha' NDAI_0F00560 [Naumovozyma dairenensis CBS 421]|uniref:Casein kinase II subunit alpha n=1 Tax=Naumovozyma dairenensis (strain ATCC 10597 / BCRC 20456 / CBS 421 / NBRC 0211 / NRRL Y-12639) TaxID=1071378 RepID=G0WC64_NAUDC|nr:hypothetical protein NDAI_0F00560 [Naumovozyma dairenensis CBS 421]CCD25375.1 hypothetical protein NDAI_0F00560 [Naumovozyma dairenensis CBS 421]